LVRNPGASGIGGLIIFLQGFIPATQLGCEREAPVPTTSGESIVGFLLHFHAPTPVAGQATQP
jgi:hypothetical protein